MALAQLVWLDFLFVLVFWVLGGVVDFVLFCFFEIIERHKFRFQLIHQRFLRYFLFLNFFDEFLLFLFLFF